MSDDEQRLLVALAWMAEQYLNTGDGLDSLSMSAGELALNALADRGLVSISGEGRVGVWTEAGKALLDSN